MITSKTRFSVRNPLALLVRVPILHVASITGMLGVVLDVGYYKTHGVPLADTNVVLPSLAASDLHSISLEARSHASTGRQSNNWGR